MQKASLLVVCCWLVSCGFVQSAGFEDDFLGRLGEGWWWVREDVKGWRVTGEGLEVRMQPGNKQRCAEPAGAEGTQHVGSGGCGDSQGDE